MYRLMSICLSSLLFLSNLCATEFTVSSYNCGALPEHYDYIRAVSMELLMQDRYNAEPAQMALNERIQQLALKILFSKNASEQAAAQELWDKEDFNNKLDALTTTPEDTNSLNTKWYNKSTAMLTPYTVRPLKIYDLDMNEMLANHIYNMTTNDPAGFQEGLTETRRKMAQHIFQHQLKYDIICLQEADYLDESLLPDHLEVVLSGPKSTNGVAWNKNRFELLEVIGDINGRGFAVHLLEKESGKTVLIASGHLTGCNPYKVVKSPKSGLKDSLKGDNELIAIIELFESIEADIKIIGIDSNVTATHPRLAIVKDFGYQIDADTFMEMTCTNPYQILNTRLDWIAVKSSISATLTNIPVLGVGLNSMTSNLSDHKPIAGKIVF